MPFHGSCALVGDTPMSHVEKNHYGHKELRASISAGANGIPSQFRIYTPIYLSLSLLYMPVHVVLLNIPRLKHRYGQGRIPSNYLDTVNSNISSTT